jgi:hypothetical protein
MKFSFCYDCYLFQEHSFEVSLFAELFNEMLMRDFGFRIYRALNDAPERAKEDEKVIGISDKNKFCAYNKTS